MPEASHSLPHADPLPDAPQGTVSHDVRHAEAEERARLAEQMIGMISHDLRNPLSAILIGVELLSAAQPLPEEQRRALLKSVARSAHRAKRMTADLLDFSAARVGDGLAVVREPVDLHAFVGQVLDEFRPTLRGRSLVHETQGEGPCSADPERLAQLVGNLIENAVACGSPCTSITVTTSLKGPAASIGVLHDGEPLPVEAARWMFDPVVRGTAVDSSTRSVGLGLFIVREIARAHGGDADVTSGPDAGTLFSVVFPRGAASR